MEDSAPIKDKQICRTCLSHGDDGHVLKSIFETSEYDKTVSIMDLLSSAIPQITIDTSDDLPKEICTKCVSRIWNVHLFQQTCVESEIRLRSMIDFDTVEEKFSNASVILPNLTTGITEDPLKETTPNGGSLVDFGEVKEFLKLELQEAETNVVKDERELVAAHKKENCNGSEAGDCSQTEEIGGEEDFKGEEFIEEGDEFVEENEVDKAELNNTKEINNSESETCSERMDDSDWETEKNKRKNEKVLVKDRLRTKGNLLRKQKQTLQMENIVEQPNAKNRRTACLPCHECGKIFDRSYSLNRHMNVHKRNGKPFECAKCKYRFSSEAHLKRHEIVHSTELTTIFSSVPSNPEGYKCSDCPRRFAKRESLSAHKQSHSKSNSNGDDETLNTFACNLCPKTFKKLGLLTRHSRNHEENKQFKCHICGKAFGLNAHLIDHINKHNGVKPYVCNFCSKAFQQSCTLKDHIRTHTGEQPFLCSECGKAFNSSSNMKQHLLRHTGEKRYSCPECPKKFPCLSDLASHMAVHKKVKPHVCDVCGSAFGKPYQLKKHKMYHNGEKPHKCEYCEMRFVCADHMRRHMRTHTGEKPYKCKYCERAFAQSNDLVKHLRSHIGENIYKCELCPLAFRLASELREHFAEHKTKNNDRMMTEDQKDKLELRQESTDSNDQEINTTKNSSIKEDIQK